MSLFSEDKCFNCYHTDFYSRSSECSRSRLQHCTSFYVVSLYSPPGFTKQTHKKQNQQKRMLSLSSGWLPVCEKGLNASLNCSTTETSQKQILNGGRDVAEKDNVLLTLCCSKNSYNQENGEGEGGVYLQDHLRSTRFSAPRGCWASVTAWI